jgi:hypothetical protein
MEHQTTHSTNTSDNTWPAEQASCLLQEARRVTSEMSRRGASQYSNDTWLLGRADTRFEWDNKHYGGENLNALSTAEVCPHCCPVLGAMIQISYVHQSTGSWLWALSSAAYITRFTISFSAPAISTRNLFPLPSLPLPRAGFSPATHCS